MGARKLPYGPVNVKVEALDEFGNASRREIVVRRVDPASMPVQRPVVALRLSGKGMKRKVRGRVTAPGAAFRPGGKVVIEWQYRRKGRWVTLHKRSKNASRPFRYAQRLRKQGRWRVVARYRARAVHGGAVQAPGLQRALNHGSLAGRLAMYGPLAGRAGSAGPINLTRRARRASPRRAGRRRRVPRRRSAR